MAFVEAQSLLVQSFGLCLVYTPCIRNGLAVRQVLSGSRRHEDKRLQVQVDLNGELLSLQPHTDDASGCNCAEYIHEGLYTT